MEHVNFILLSVFWVGLALLVKKDRIDLKARITQYLGLEKNENKSRLTAFIRRMRYAGRKREMDRELSESLAYIKNMVVLGRGGSISAQLLFDELSEITDILSDTYLKMSGYMSTNESSKAAACLHDVIDESYAADLGRFLAGWEDIPSEELLPSIDAYQSSLREMRETEQKRRDEAISDLIYFPVVLNCMAVLMNFIYVGFFIPQKEMLSILF